MKPEYKLKVQNVLIIIAICLLFGLLYNYLFYPHTITEFLEAGSISILIGLLVGILEQFVFLKLFKNKPFLSLTLFRAGLYSILTSLVLCAILSIEIALSDEITYGEAFMQYITGNLFLRDFAFTFAIIIVTLFSFQIILLIGKSNFIRLILGWYHQPSEVNRIFMFVDLRGSTSLGETLSAKTYSNFVQDYFYDISDAIALYKGEVYQYVGDEIVLVWRVKKDNSRCIKTFFKMIDIINKRSDYYLSKYSVLPEFKAGIHFGKVIATQVGKVKKELVYHGDVLNTAARIEGQCNVLKEQLLISEDFKMLVDPINGYEFNEKGAIELKGKALKLSLYGVQRNSKN